jgi:LysM repeat protein
MPDTAADVAASSGNQINVDAMDDLTGGAQVLQSATPLAGFQHIQDGNNSYIADSQSQAQSNEYNIDAGLYREAANNNTAAAAIDNSQYTTDMNEGKLVQAATLIADSKADASAAYGQNAEATALTNAANAYVATPPAATGGTLVTTTGTTGSVSPYAPYSPPAATIPPASSTTGTTTGTTGSTDTSPITFGYNPPIGSGTGSNTGNGTSTTGSNTGGSDSTSTSSDPTQVVASTSTTGTTTDTSDNSGSTGSAASTSDDTASSAVTGAIVTSDGSTTGGSASSGDSTYTVKSGDTMWGIAQANGVSLQSLEAANAANVPNPDLIHPGEAISIPGGGSATATSTSDSSSGSTSYTVKSGDTMWGIAQANGVSLQSLEAANAANVPNPDLIYPGQSVNIPGGATTTSTTVTDTSLNNAIGNVAAASPSSPESNVMTTTSASSSSTDTTSKHSTSLHGV